MFPFVNENHTISHSYIFTDFELIPLRSGRQLLRVGSFTYSTNGRELTKMWYCSKRIRGKCQARAKFHGNEIITFGIHNHQWRKLYFIHGLLFIIVNENLRSETNETDNEMYAIINVLVQKNMTLLCSVYMLVYKTM